MKKLNHEKIETAIEIIKKNPENIGVSLLKRHLSVGVIEANRILEALEDYGVISKYDDGKRRLLQDEQENKINLNFNYKVAADGIYIGKKNTGKEVVVIDESYKFVTKEANEELKRIQKVSKFKMGRYV